MNLLITGGAGYIGSHTSLSFLDLQHSVTIIDNLEGGHIQLVPKKAQFIKGDVSNKNLITEVLKNNKFDAAIHFAGSIEVEESVLNPEKYFYNNTYKSKVFFDTCVENKLTNFIFSSTASVYGETSKNVNEETPLNPLNPYAESKVRIEDYLKKLSNKNLAHFVSLRYFNVAGADKNKRSGLISKKSTHLVKIVSEVASGKRKFLTVYGNDYPTKDGTAIRDYIHISDLADIHLCAVDFLLKKKKSMILNCGYGVGYSVREVIDSMNNLIPHPIKIKFGNRRPGDCHYSVADNKKLLKNFSWKPKYNNLEFILSTSLEWERGLK